VQKSALIFKTITNHQIKGEISYVLIIVKAHIKMLQEALLKIGSRSNFYLQNW
jgi:hypothetical protein